MNDFLHETPIPASEKPRYPRISQLGIKVIYSPVPHVKSVDVDLSLSEHGLKRRQFAEFFGCQTCPAGGMYPWDVEAVLERMLSGKLTGSQELWD